MAARRLSMRKTREILRLCLGHGLSDRAVAKSVGTSPTTVGDCVMRAKVQGPAQPLAEGLDDAALEALLYPPPRPSRQARVEPDWGAIHRELRRKGVTLELLWQEYKAVHGEDGYQYSQFCEHYRRYRSQLDVVMRQQHPAGEKMFVDFSGDGIPIVDPVTGEVSKAELFVAVLGASNYTYAQVMRSQDLYCWVMGHVHAYEYFGGVPMVTVPDNPKVGVTRACYYEPELNPTYQDMARHYDTAIIPARPHKPRDKATVENGVLIAQRWVIAALRNEVFFSIKRAGDAVGEKTEDLNDRMLQKLNVSRKDLFISLDRPALKPLPRSRYEFCEWNRHLVGYDYHIEVDDHYYSVPHQLVRHRVESRLTATTVEVISKGRRIASHERSFMKGRHTTLPEHMPESHRRYRQWTPAAVMEWAESIGPATTQLAQRIIEERPHIDQGCRSCLGLKRLGQGCGNDRLEAASARAMAIGAYSYKSVKSILDNHLDKKPLKEPKEKAIDNPIEHENIRGPEYYS
jgi:transposase